MCEYLRPVVALEWLKACCTDMITWICQALRLGRNTEHDDSKLGTTSHGDVEEYTSHWRSLMH